MVLQSKILIVEDSAIQAEALRCILAAEGYAVTVAKDGADGLAKTKELRPELVISDILMPEMNGFELCRHIKDDEGIRKTPVILLTQLSDPTDIIKGLECSADSFITKPYDGNYLLSKVRDVLLNREADKDETAEQGVEIYFAGNKHFITSTRKQILDLLMSTYESAVQKNNELIAAQEETIALNEQLKAKTESFTGIVDRTSDGILIVDAEGKIKYYNESAKLLLKRPNDDLIDSEFGLPLSSDSFIEIDIVLRSEEKGVAEMRVDKTEWEGEDASLVIIRDITVRKQYEESLIKTSAELTAEIDERKKARESVEKLSHRNKMILDAAGEGIIGLDNEGRHIFINPAAAKMLGYSIDELLGKRSHEIWHHTKPDGSPFPAVECPVYAAYKDGKIHSENNGLFWKKDGTSFPVEYTSTPIIEKEKISGSVVVFNDITAWKMAEERINTQLEHLRALREIDAAIASNVSLHVILDIFLEQASNQLHVDAAAIFLLNPYTLLLDHAASKGFQTERIKHVRLKIGDSWAGQVAEGRKSILLSDISKEEFNLLTEKGYEFRQSILVSKEGFRAYCGAPLMVKGQLKGVFEVFHRTPLYPDAEWIDFFDSLAGQAAIGIDNAAMVDELRRSHDELVLAYETTIEGWSKALDYRDKETEGHSQRVTDMTLHMARAMGVPESELVHIKHGALLHDIGKLGIPDNILLKPVKLTEEEFDIMKRHTEIAFELLSPILYLQPALDIPYFHHEKWDGTGYPKGLKGEQIPLAARIFAIVDVYDALNSDRPYRSAWPKEKIIEHIRSLTGTHFDPRVSEFFSRIIESGENEN